LSVGSNIKKRRLDLRLSQQELADMMGYRSRSTIAKIESGENDVSQKKLKKFAIALDIPLEALIAGVRLEPNRLTRHGTTIKPRHNRNIAVILAGGNSDQSRQNIPGQFLSIKGDPIIMHCLTVYQEHPLIDDIYVVCLKGWEKILENYAEQYRITKLKDLIPAGSSGILSLKNAIDHLRNECSSEDVIIIQESTRPRINADILSKLLQACAETGSAILCYPMKDYVQFDISGEHPKYIDRNTVVSLQSPEAHRFSLLNRVFAAAEAQNHPFTESCCAMLLYNLGHQINFIENSVNNVKISDNEDLISFSAFVQK